MYRDISWTLIILCKSLALVITPETGHVTSQFNVVFDDEFSTVPFMREGIIPPNWTDLVQRRSQSGAIENIDLEDTWFTPDLEEYPRETPTHMPIDVPYNNRNILTSLLSLPQVQESPSIEGVSVSEVIKFPDSE